MKKITIVSVFSLVFLGICSIVADGLKYLELNNEWQLLLTGVAILVFSGVVSLNVRKN
jgi:ribose/xylose/arabinose/galactoside ABC-type transport system permease subunit